jgi:Mycothiol maleylpyruvate isomerase N-terminal domain
MTSDAPDDKARSVAARVADYRCRVADAFETLTVEQWESPSWCSGWRVRYVLGHLVHNAEASRLSMVRDVVRHPIRPDKGSDLIARQLGDEPVPTLARRLRKAQHGGVRRRRTRRRPRPPKRRSPYSRPGVWSRSSDDAVAVLNAYRRVGGLIFHARPSGRLRLVATDVKWWCGQGPEVTGRAIDLVMLMANRQQIVGTLSGPGVADLAA